MLKTFAPKEIKNEAGHIIRPVKMLTNEAKEAMKRVEIIENMEKEKLLMLAKEKRDELVNNDKKVERAIQK